MMSCTYIDYKTKVTSIVLGFYHRSIKVWVSASQIASAWLICLRTNLFQDLSKLINLGFKSDAIIS
jgi:hypothetical protein